jgi:hypothetical protein
MVEVVAELALLERVAAGDDVEQQPAAGDPLERRRLMRGQCGGDEARPTMSRLSPFVGRYQCT